MTTDTKRLAKLTAEPRFNTSSREMRRFLTGAIVTLFASLLLIGYLSPFGYMAVTSLKDLPMISDVAAPELPSVPETFVYEDEEVPDREAVYHR